MNVLDLSCYDSGLILSTGKDIRLVTLHPFITEQRTSRIRHHPTSSVI